MEANQRQDAATAPSQTNLPLPTGTVAGGIAISPVNSDVWVVDKREFPLPKNGLVYHLKKPWTGTPDTITLPRPTEAPSDAVPYPMYVTLEIREGSVERVWVTDYGIGAVYYFSPDEKNGSSAQILDLGGLMPTVRGLLWDEPNQIIWIATSVPSTLIEVDLKNQKPPFKKTAVIQVPSKSPGQMIIARGKVWFTCMEDASLGMLDPADLSVPPVFYDTRLPGDEDSAELYGIQVAPNGKKLWFTAHTRSELWTVDDITAEKIMLRKVHSFDANSSPRELTIDTNGYLWVSLQDKASFAIFQSDGSLVGIYPVSDSKPGMIVTLPASSGVNEIWMSDERTFPHVQQRLVRLTNTQTPIATKISVYSGSPQFGHVNLPFGQQLQAKVEAATPLGIPALFTIDSSASGSGTATFVMGKHDPSSQSSQILCTSDGVATITIYALDVVGQLKVNATVPGTSLDPAVFTLTVTPVPDLITWPPETYSFVQDRINEKPFKLTVTAGGVGVLGESVDIAITASNAYFVPKGVDPTTSQLTSISVKTIQDGTITLDRESDYGVYLVPGCTTVSFNATIKDVPNITNDPRIPTYPGIINT